MNSFSNRSYLLNDQYQNASNLNARMQLHMRFSTNPYGWHRWMFDQLDLPVNARVLELGCGPAKFWLENLKRLPPSWKITLSDFSPGMLAQAQQNLVQAGHAFRFEQLDAQSIPFDDASFDAVIANHMLYHLPDLPKGLSEIQRVLKPGGRLYAATNGIKHLHEMDGLIRQFNPEIEFLDSASLKFTLENGQELLAPFFSQVEVQHYPDALIVTKAAPLAAYIFSMIRITYFNNDQKKAKFLKYIKDILQKNSGQLRISKASGLFIAQG